MENRKVRILEPSKGRQREPLFLTKHNRVEYYITQVNHELHRSRTVYDISALRSRCNIYTILNILLKNSNR